MLTLFKSVLPIRQFESEKFFSSPRSIETMMPKQSHKATILPFSDHHQFMNEEGENKFNIVIDLFYTNNSVLKKKNIEKTLLNNKCRALTFDVLWQKKIELLS